MFIAYVVETKMTGRILKQNLSLREAIIERKKLGGNLVFTDDGQIVESTDWLFDWELVPKRTTPTIKYYYARSKQLNNFNLTGYTMTVGYKSRFKFKF